MFNFCCFAKISINLYSVNRYKCSENLFYINNMAVFIFGFKGKKKITKPENTQEFMNFFLQKVKRTFELSEVANIQQTSNSVSFSGPIFRFAWNGLNFLNGTTSATVEIVENNDALTVKYRLMFTEWFFISLVMSIILFTIRNMPTLLLAVFFFVWGILYGGTCLISIVRFRRFISDTLIEQENK